MTVTAPLAAGQLEAVNPKKPCGNVTPAGGAAGVPTKALPALKPQAAPPPVRVAVPVPVPVLVGPEIMLTQDTATLVTLAEATVPLPLFTVQT